MKKKSIFTVQNIAEIGMLVAMAILFDQSFMKIRLGENGGSISLTMIPLFILCYRCGFIKGFIGCGLIYGFITCLTDGWGFATYPLDYLLGYGCISIVGFFASIIINDNVSKILRYLYLILSVIIALILRTLFSTISGVVFYEMNFVASLVYNFPYIWISGAVTLVALILLLPVLTIIFRKFNKNGF